jgi:hypothetical protein
VSRVSARFCVAQPASTSRQVRARMLNTRGMVAGLKSVNSDAARK